MLEGLLLCCGRQWLICRVAFDKLLRIIIIDWLQLEIFINVDIY